MVNLAQFANFLVPSVGLTVVTSCFDIFCVKLAIVLRLFFPLFRLAAIASWILVLVVNLTNFSLPIFSLLRLAAAASRFLNFLSIWPSAVFKFFCSVCPTCGSHKLMTTCLSIWAYFIHNFGFDCSNLRRPKSISESDSFFQCGQFQFAIFFIPSVWHAQRSQVELRIFCQYGHMLFVFKIFLFLNLRRSQGDFWCFGQFDHFQFRIFLIHLFELRVSQVDYHFLVKLVIFH